MGRALAAARTELRAAGARRPTATLLLEADSIFRHEIGAECHTVSHTEPAKHGSADSFCWFGDEHCAVRVEILFLSPRQGDTLC